MEARLTVQINDADLQRKLRTAIVLLGPEGGRTLMRAIGLAMKRSTLDKFKAQGPGWQELDPATIRNRRDVRKATAAGKQRKTKRGRERAQARLAEIIGSVKILDDTGTLRRSVDYEATSTSVEIGTDLYYGPFHQTGTVHMPERAFMTLTPADEQRLSGLTDRYLQRALP